MVDSHYGTGDCADGDVAMTGRSGTAYGEGFQAGERAGRLAASDEIRQLRIDSARLRDEAFMLKDHPRSSSGTSELRQRAENCAKYDFDMIEMIECKWSLWDEILEALSSDGRTDEAKAREAEQNVVGGASGVADDHELQSQTGVGSERSSPSEAFPSPETVAALPDLLNEAFMAGEIGIWNILPWAAAEIERLRTRALPSGEVELAAWLCALEDAECHEPIPESLIEHGRMYIRAGMCEEHCGDCTNQSHSCVVCGTDGYLLHARQILAALASSPTPPFSRWADTIEAASLTISPKGSKELDELAAEVRAGGAAQAAPDRPGDTELLNWLEEQVIDTIYLDDGRMIDVKGNSVRAAIFNARLSTVSSTEGK